MIISESVFFVCGAVHVQKYICKMKDAFSIGKIIIASIILTLILYAFKNIILINQYIHLIITFVVAMVVYSAFILLTKTLNKEDIAMIKHET
jgi:hypothetical protein